MVRLQERFALAFSPLFTALGSGYFAAFGLIILSFVGPHPSRYIWYGLLTVMGVGVVLQFGTRRVLYFRTYDALAWSLAAVVFAMLVWSVTMFAWGQRSPVLAAAVISAMLAGFAALVFINYYRSPQRKLMPYGGTGKMNQNSGVIVDLRYIELSPAVREANDRGVRTVAQLSPLIAGLTMLMVRSVADNIAVLLFIPVGVILGAIATFGAARYLSFAISTARWEREHGKRIYVKR